MYVTLRINQGVGTTPTPIILTIKKFTVMKTNSIYNQNYTHFAVNKETGKIVNGWDYSDVESWELKQFKRDYFIVDLIDYDLDPKQYKILTTKSLQRQGIDPFNSDNWANA